MRFWLLNLKSIAILVLKWNENMFRFFQRKIKQNKDDILKDSIIAKEEIIYWIYRNGKYQQWLLHNILDGLNLDVAETELSKFLTHLNRSDELRNFLYFEKSNSLQGGGLLDCDNRLSLTSEGRKIASTIPKRQKERLKQAIKKQQRRKEVDDNKSKINWSKWGVFLTVLSIIITLIIYYGEISSWVESNYNNLKLEVINDSM